MISQDSIREKTQYLWSVLDYLIKHMNWTELEVFVFLLHMYLFYFGRTARKITTTGQNKVIENLRKGYRRIYDI